MTEIGESADRTYKTAAVIATALITGQLLFAEVAWYLRSTNQMPSGTNAGPAMLYIWLAVAVGGLTGANIVRQRLANARDSGAALTGSTAITQSGMMWALLEAGGLMGVVLYLLSGRTQVLYGVLAFIIVSALLFFPRRDWYGR